MDIVVALVAQSCLTLCDPTDGQASPSLGFPSKNTGEGCRTLLQGILSISLSQSEVLGASPMAQW